MPLINSGTGVQVTVGFPDGAAHQAESLRRNRPSPRAAILTKTGCQIAARSSTLISEILPPAFHHFLYVMPESRRQSKYATFHAVCLDSHLRQNAALPGCLKWQMWPGAVSSDT